MEFLPVSLDAVLVELDDLAQTLALLRSLQVNPIAGVEEMVPAARTLMVRYRPAALSEAELSRRIGARDLSTYVEAPGTLIEIPVEYDGADLAEVAGLIGITPAEVVRRHTGTEYVVAFTGFAPGFAYLSGGDATLDVPRRTTPRTRISAGAVGLAGRFSGVYPTASPGGWQILGVTRLPMWDLAREVPALLQPGLRVRFVDVSVRGAAPLPEASSRLRKVPSESVSGADHVRFEVIATGVQALFQDRGRQGQAGQGVSASGAMDVGASRASNRLVGNDPGATCIEIVDGGFECVCRGEAVVAVTGADSDIDLVSADGVRVRVDGNRAFAMSVGDRLRLGTPQAGLRNYLAVRGGFAVTPVLQSCSTDTLARLGPPPIAAGDVLSVSRALHGVVGNPSEASEKLPTKAEVITLDIVMGPRTDWFTPEAVALLAAQVWTVTPQSNRVGLRLAGEHSLTRANSAELPSEGTSLGAIQVPPSGQPVLFLADHPLTGGYPVIGAVAPHHLDRAGQIPIGGRVRFNPIRPFRRLKLFQPPETP